ncbi:MAG TPA: type II toxin-antitoxin system VapC family toxin [Candidatus Methanoperedens sp.]|nr:type II toxin-antitoxin system VapC family toxin [Candidatus Methanoperedens sp.]
MTVFDTNFLVDLLNDEPGISYIADSFEHPKTTTINAFELFYGAWQSSKPRENIREINSLLKSLSILEVDLAAAQKAAEIHAGLKNSGSTLELEDVLIAGIVMTNNEELVTRNINHFKRIPGLKYRSWQPGDYGR